MFSGEYINGPKDSDEEMVLVRIPKGERLSLFALGYPPGWRVQARLREQVLCSKKLTFLRVRDLLKKEVQIDIFTINYSIFGLILKAMKRIISLEI